MSNSSTKSPKRVLEPLDRISEFLFGLITVLTFTTTLEATGFDRGNVHKMLLAALCCNLAWAIIDASFYLLDCLGRRGRNIALLKQLQRTGDPVRGKQIIEDALPPLIASLVSPSEYESLRRQLIQLPESIPRAWLAWEDWLGALGVFLLVFLSMFPVVVPFLLVRDASLALGISHVIAILSLFFAGYSFGRFTHTHPWRSGLVMVVVGVAVIGVTNFLGG
jgi:hypothetical protein